MRVGDDRVKKAMAQQLHQKFDLATFDNGETVEDYTLRLSGMAAHLATLGEEVKDGNIITKMLRSLPPRFKQITITIKTLLDVSTMFVADLIVRLKEAEEAFEEAPTSLQQDGKLYLTVEWDARRKKREAVVLTKAVGAAGVVGAVTLHQAGHRASPPTTSVGAAARWSIGRVSSKPKKEQAHVAQDEDEASLLLATGTLIRPEVGQTKAGSPTAPAREVRPPGESSAGTLAQGFAKEVEIHEEKVFAHHDLEKERDAGTWVRDTEATNHMSRCRAAFTKIDTVVLGTVRFGDDSVAQIEDRGTVVFVCKNGKCRSFDGVYFIPRLTTNIVSASQLNDIGYKIDIDTGVMKIREPGGVLLAKVKREENRLYLLHLKFTQPTCLAVRECSDEVAWCWYKRFSHVNMAAL
jgi:hypothetical protein